MKYKARDCATALADLMLEKKTPAQEKKLTAAFLAFLIKNGDVYKAKEIMELAETLFIQKTGRRKVIMETARRLDKKTFLKSFLQSGDIVQEKINKDLIAGVKIIINDRQLDFSLAAKLQHIFK